MCPLHQHQRPTPSLETPENVAFLEEGVASCDDPKVLVGAGQAPCAAGAQGKKAMPALSWPALLTFHGAWRNFPETRLLPYSCTLWGTHPGMAQPDF